MSNNWQTLSSDIVYENPWYKVEHDTIIRPNGDRGEFNTVIKPPAVHIIVETAEQKVLLVHLYRYSVKRMSWEVPAGAIEAGETPLQAAQRELREETGYEAAEWIPLGVIETGAGYLNAPCHQFIARQLTATGNNQQAEEGITAMQAFSRSEIRRMVLEGETFDGPGVALLAKYLLSLEKD